MQKNVKGTELVNAGRFTIDHPFRFANFTIGYEDDPGAIVVDKTESGIQFKKECEINQQFFDQRLVELALQYPNAYVAICEKCVVGHHQDPSELYDFVKKSFSQSPLFIGNPTERLRGISEQ